MPALSPEQYRALGPYIAVAERLGNFAAHIAAGNPKRVRLVYQGRIADNNTHLLRNAGVAGVLNRSLAHKANLVNAMQIAAQRGWGVAESTEQRSGHTDSIRVELETDRGVTSVEGAVLLDNPRLLQVDGIYCEAPLSGHLIFMKNHDVPGVIGHVGTVLGKNSINIANFSLGRRETPRTAGEPLEAVAVVSTDATVPETGAGSTAPESSRQAGALRRILVTDAARAPRPGIWRDLREAVAGSQQDFTEGAIPRAVLLLAVPMVLEMVMESLFGIVDVFFVARLGADAIATVGLTESMLSLVFGVAMGLSMATTAMVARRIGEKDPEGAAVAAVHSIGIGVVVSLVIAIASFWLAPRLLGWMGASPSIVATGSTYTRVMLGGVASIFLLFLINAIFRGAGDAAIAMRYAVDRQRDQYRAGPVPHQRLGAVSAHGRDWRGRRHHDRPFHRRHLPACETAGRTRARQSTSPPDQAGSRSAAAAGTRLPQRHVPVSDRDRKLARPGAHRGHLRQRRDCRLHHRDPHHYFRHPAFLGNGQRRRHAGGPESGRGKPARAERSVWLTGFYNMIFLGAVAVIFVAFAERIIGLFTNDPAVLPLGVACLRFVSYGYVFYAYGMVMVQAFNGAGDTLTPTFINFFCYWLFQIPLAYTLAIKTSMGPNGVFLAIAISESTLAVVAMVFFRRGKWKKQQI